MRGNVSRGIELEDADKDEEEEEKDNMHDWCVRAFMLFLVGCTILSDERNKHINLM